MKKYVRILQILAVSLVMIAGVWIGMKIEQGKAEKQEAYAQGVNTTVAVVNQDLGVTVSGQTVNYANAVIETLGSYYTVVSASVAQNGLEQGTYGAIVTFPADFSENIVSINRKTPNQAVMSIAINPNLPEDRYVALYTQLVSMQQQVNNNIAYAYVETVYEQLHSAQDEIDELLANDEADMAAVSQVTLTNYTEMLDLGEMPTVEMELTSPDYAEFIADAQTIADDMNQVYVDSYADAQADFALIKNQIAEYETEITNQNAIWVASVNDWSDSVYEYEQNILEYQQALDEWRDKAAAYREEEVSYAEALKSSGTELENWRNSVNGVLSDSGGDMDKISAAAGVISEKATDVDNAVSAYNAEIANLSTWLTYLEEYQKYCNDPNNLNPPAWPNTPLPKSELQPLTNNVSASVTDMNNALAALKIRIETEIPKSPDVYTIAAPSAVALADTEQPFLEEVPTSQYIAVPFATAPAQPQELTDALTGIVTTSAGYNPEAYLDEQTRSEAQQSITQYAGYLSGVESDLTSNNANNLLLLNSAYRDYNMYIGDLRMNVYDVHTREQDILATSIAGLSDTLTYTSTQNHELMDSFVSRMPNSRLNSTVNQMVVEGTVSPVTYSYNYIRQDGAGGQGNTDQWPLIAAAILIGAAILDLLLMCREARKEE